MRVNNKKFTSFHTYDRVFLFKLFKNKKFKDIELFGLMA